MGDNGAGMELFLKAAGTALRALAAIFLLMLLFAGGLAIGVPIMLLRLSSRLTHILAQFAGGG